MLEKALEHLTSQIDEKILRLQESLASGVAKDYAEYQRMCGEIQGLLTARLNTTDLKRNIEEIDD
jgi:hypothetical protein